MTTSRGRLSKRVCWGTHTGSQGLRILALSRRCSLLGTDVRPFGKFQNSRYTSMRLLASSTMSLIASCKGISLRRQRRGPLATTTRLIYSANVSRLTTLFVSIDIDILKYMPKEYDRTTMVMGSLNVTGPTGDMVQYRANV
ncbi:hypothetical protein M758_UG052400 [Ceratodon purpureus]|nr:hypothetical protein M758_UG052400 [Ceratodon purpureus]